MSFFDEDPFEDIVREFFGDRPSARRRGRNEKTIIEGEEEERNIDFVEDEDYVYIIFELPGYNEKDISIGVMGRELEINAGKRSSSCSAENVQNYLTGKLCQGTLIKKTLPKFVNPKNFNHSMKNGILEVTFSKK